MGFFNNVTATATQNQNSVNDLDSLLAFLDNFKQSLSSSERALFADLFDDFKQSYGGVTAGSPFRNIINGGSADELLALFKGLSDIPDLFQGRIPPNLDTVGKLEFIRDNLSPKYEGFASTINDLIRELKTRKIEGTPLDDDLSSLISLIGNRGKSQMVQPINQMPPQNTGPAVNGGGDPMAANNAAANNNAMNSAAGNDGMSGAGGAGGSVQEALIQDIVQNAERDSRKGGAAKKGSNRSEGQSSSEEGISGRGGGSIFEAIALALGEAMTAKLQGLLEAAEGVKSSDEDVLEKSAQVTARGQELNAVSQAFNSSINSVGQAASTAARKT